MTLLAAVAVVALVAACATTPASSSPAPRTELIVFGAASLRRVLADLDDVYATEQPGVDLTVSTDASSALATRIVEGAEADVFLAADETAPRRLLDAGLVDGELVAFAGNRLTVIVPAGNPAGVDSPADLVRPGLKIIAAGEEVPITRYAAMLIDQLGKRPEYPTGFAAGYAANVVSREDNVAAVVAKIALGEGDAAIVYVTDALASGDVERIDVPDPDRVRARYAGAVLRASRRLDAARAFMTWLVAPTGQSILRRAGF
jgi:molybdate transport system substrate-binding protein